MNSEWLKATTLGSLERIRALLEEGTEVNSKDRCGQTALMNASRDGRAPGFADKTALPLAREAGRMLIVESLRAAGAEE